MLHILPPKTLHIGVWQADICRVYAFAMESSLLLPMYPQTWPYLPLGTGGPVPRAAPCRRWHQASCLNFFFLLSLVVVGRGQVGGVGLCTAGNKRKTSNAPSSPLLCKVNADW